MSTVAGGFLFRAYCIVLAAVEIPALFSLLFRGASMAELGLWYSKSGGSSIEASVLGATFLAFLVIVRVAVALDSDRNTWLGFVAVMMHTVEIVTLTLLYRANILNKGREVPLTSSQLMGCHVVLLVVYINPLLFLAYFAASNLE